jgi:hypothetical protein
MMGISGAGLDLCQAIAEQDERARSQDGLIPSNGEMYTIKDKGLQAF